MTGPATALVARLDATRRRTRDLFAPLSPEDLARQPSPILSPPLWDLGHIAAYEELWLVRRLTGAPSLHPELEDVYDAFETPRSRRGNAPILDEDAAHRYLDDVRERSLEALAGADLSDDGGPLTVRGFVFDMVAQHEAQHTETVLQSLQTLPQGAYRPPVRRPLPAPRERVGGWVEVPGGTFAMGAGPESFAYDCERPRHPREVGPFLIARDPVSAGEHLEFMRDGGYRRPELWTAAGWEWREREEAEAPLYWQPDGEGGWLARGFDRLEPVDPDRPLCHVSAHEADAHARWAGARLPTEAEWEYAARAGTTTAYWWGELPDVALASCFDCTVKGRRAGIQPVGSFKPNPWGLYDTSGNANEWVADWYAYDYYRHSPEQSPPGPDSGRDRVQRGGSSGSKAADIRSSARGYGRPDLGSLIVGFRLVNTSPGAEPLAAAATSGNAAPTEAAKPEAAPAAPLSVYQQVDGLIAQIKASSGKAEKGRLKVQARALLKPELDFGTIDSGLKTASSAGATPTDQYETRYRFLGYDAENDSFRVAYKVTQHGTWSAEKRWDSTQPMRRLGTIEYELSFRLGQLYRLMPRSATIFELSADGGTAISGTAPVYHCEVPSCEQALSRHALRQDANVMYWFYDSSAKRIQRLQKALQKIMYEINPA